MDNPRREALNHILAAHRSLTYALVRMAKLEAVTDGGEPGKVEVELRNAINKTVRALALVREVS